jgi:hypothetical protein
MVSESKILSSNLIDYVIYLPFQLNISCVGPYLLKDSLSTHKKKLKILIE